MQNPEASAIEMLRTSATPISSVRAGSAIDDLPFLDSWAGNARVIGLGEATHGTREFFQLKHRIFEYLVTECDFNLFLIEAEFAQSLAINRYVLTGEGDGAHSLNSLRLWDCDEMLELIEWMRSWNASHDSKVYFYGVDMQGTGSALHILHYLKLHQPETYAGFRNALLPLTVDANPFSIDWWSTLSDVEKANARTAIGAVDAALRNLAAIGSEAQHELDIARLHAAVLCQYEQMTRDPSMHHVVNVRDRAMADNVLALLDLHGADSKAVFWAHNCHVQLRPADPWGGNTPTAGEHLRKALDERYFALGFTFDRGKFDALDSTMRHHRCEVSSSTNSLGEVFARIGSPIFAVDLRCVPFEVGEWLATAPSSRAIGGMYYEALEPGLWIRVDPRRLFDAIIFVSETTAIHPSAAVYEFELRREDPPEPNGFANLDFSHGLEGWRMRRQPAVGAYRVESVAFNRGNGIAISRSESFWPWDNFSLFQVASAAPWRGKRVKVRCDVSMCPTHDGGSAQLAVRILKKTVKKGAAGLDEFNEDMKENSWIERAAWQRAVTRDSVQRELSLTLPVEETADTIGLALLIAGDGEARFGPIEIDADVGNGPSDA
jgi:erythromycin esterase